MLSFFVRKRLFRVVAVFALLVALFAQSAVVQAASVSDAELKAALERLLREHPELVLDVLKNNSELVLEVAQQGNILRKRKAAMAQWNEDAKRKKSPDLAERAFRGNVNAPVTIVAYSDFTCPYCRQAEHTMAQLLQKYNGRIRLTFKALPKENYPLSLAAAKYATAAFMMDQAKGWLFFDALFAGMDQFERDGESFLKESAAKAGLDFRRLKADAGSDKVQERLNNDRAEADKYDISGTPCFLINDLVIRGALSKDLFEDAIEMALRLKKKQ